MTARCPSCGRDVPTRAGRYTEHSVKGLPLRCAGSGQTIEEDQ